MNPFLLALLGPMMPAVTFIGRLTQSSEQRLTQSGEPRLVQSE